MTTIPLGRGQSAIIDDEDAPRVLARRWGARKGRGARSLGADRVDLASFILRVGHDQHIRYLDGNRYNCQRANLQVEGRSHQTQRAQIPTGGTGYRGVCRDRRDGKYEVYVKKDYQRRYLGRFDTAEDAARTYDRAARELFGDAARVNFP